jgi:hypothetical protein
VPWDEPVDVAVSLQEPKLNGQISKYVVIGEHYRKPPACGRQ